MASLFKHKNGIWYIKFTQDKRIVRKSTHCRSKSDANLFFREFNPKKTASRNLNSLISEVLEYSRIYTKKNMQGQYLFILNNFLKFTGNKPLTDVSKNNIANYIKFRQSVTNKNNVLYSASSINAEIAILKHSFEIAINNGWLESNPARQIKKIPVTNRVPEFTLYETDLLLNELKTLPEIKYYYAVKIALNTGMRRGEISNLLWGDVDLQNREIHLKNKINKKAEFVTINQSVFDILTSLPININGRVFDIQENYLYEVVKKCIKRLGLNPKLRFHSLRHTFITEAVNKYGIHIGQELARHSNISMTAKYYHSKKEEIKQKAKGISI